MELNEYGGEEGCLNCEEELDICEDCYEGGFVGTHNFKGMCSQITCSKKYIDAVEVTVPLRPKMKLFCGKFKERYGKDKTHMTVLIPLCKEHHDRFEGFAY